MKTPKIYRLQRPDLPWGDYGDVLAHGFADRSDDGSSLLLQRTGPFIPPFSQPSRMYVVVTAPLLRKLQESGLTGFAVLPVEVTKSPMIDWRVWQPYGNKEMKYPAGGEPESYILRRKHSPEASSNFGELSEIQFQPAIDFIYGQDAHVAASSWTKTDFFVARQERPIYKYVSNSRKGSGLFHKTDLTPVSPPRRADRHNENQRH